MGSRGKTLGKMSSTKLGKVMTRKPVKGSDSKPSPIGKALLFVPEGVSPKKQELNIQIVAVDPKNFAAMVMRRS